MKYENAKREDQTTLTVPEVEIHLLGVLDKSVKGDTSGWRRAETILQCAEQGHDDGVNPNLDTFTCWAELSPRLKERLFAAAERFLQSARPTDEGTLLRSNVIKAIDIQAYAALAVLVRQAPDRAAFLSGGLWRKWAATIVAGSHENTTEATELGKPVRLALYRHAPTEMLHAYREQIHFYALRNYFLVGRQLQDIWDTEVEKFVLAECRSMRSSASVWLSLVSLLLDQGSVAGATYARYVALRRGPHAAQVAALLLRRDGRSWPAIYARLQRDEQFNNELLTLLTDGYRYVNLDEEATALLFRVVVQHFPYLDGPEAGVDTAQKRDKASEFKNALLSRLEQAGTPSAIKMIQRLKSDFPRLFWLNSTLERAMTVTERQTWKPFPAETLLEFLQLHDRRVVNSPEQLLSVIQESVTRIVAELRAEHLPLVNSLWNEWKEGETPRWKPKMEEHLSDWVAAYLQRDLKGRGIIVNRETQISRGQFTDVLVSAIPEARTGMETQRIDVVIEIKGSWHEEVKTAMKTQLVETYLRERKANVGLYLVGWYYIPGLYDKKPGRVNSWEDLQVVLDSQAQELSRGVVKVQARVIDLRPILNTSTKSSRPQAKTRKSAI